MTDLCFFAASPSTTNIGSFPVPPPSPNPNLGSPPTRPLKQNFIIPRHPRSLDVQPIAPRLDGGGSLVLELILEPAPPLALALDDRPKAKPIPTFVCRCLTKCRWVDVQVIEPIAVVRIGGGAIVVTMWPWGILWPVCLRRRNRAQLR